MEILTPAEVDRIEHTWEMGYETTGDTMALIRTVRALRAELGTIEGLLDYFGGLAELAGKVKAVKIRPAAPGDPPRMPPALRCKCMDTPACGH